MKPLIAILLVLMTITVSQSQSLKGNKQDLDVIQQNIEKFSGYVMKGDYVNIGNSYTDDAKIMVTNRDIIEGREKIQTYWTPTGPSRTIYHKIFPQEISVQGDTAYDFGRYEGTTKNQDGGEENWKGKYVIIWKKIGEDWKIYVDIWNRTP